MANASDALQSPLATPWPYAPIPMHACRGHLACGVECGVHVLTSCCRVVQIDGRFAFVHQVADLEVRVYDQADAEGIKRQLRGHNDTPCGRPTPGRPIGRPC